MQYKEYYDSLGKSDYKYNNKMGSNTSYFANKLMFQLAGVLILFALIIGCKVNANSKTIEIYNYSKKVINESYDYKPLVEKIKDFNIKDIKENTIQERIEKFWEKLNKNNNIKDKFKNLLPPVNGKVSSAFGKRIDSSTGKEKLHKGIDFEVPLGSDVKSCFSGVVRCCGDSKELGKYIIIDHGEGLESEYAHLDKIFVQEGIKIESGKVIAESGNTGTSKGPHLHFEIKYMGESKDPMKYLGLTKND